MSQGSGKREVPKEWLAVAIAAAAMVRANEGRASAGGELEALRIALGKTPVASWIEPAGFRVHSSEEPLVTGVDGEGFWWTLSRSGWSGVEVGETVMSRDEAIGGAVAALLDDKDIDWTRGTTRNEGGFSEAVKEIVAREALGRP